MSSKTEWNITTTATFDPSFMIMMYRYRSLNILIRSRLDDNNFDRMKVFMKLFETELDKYLNLENFVDAKVPP